MSALVRICRIALPFFSGVMSKPVIFMGSFRELGIEFAILSLAHCLNWDFWDWGDYWEVVLVVGGCCGDGLV